MRPDARPQARGCPSLHVSRLTFHGSWERAENDADGRRSFAAVERSMSDRLLRQADPLLQARRHQQTTFSIDNDGLDIRQLFD